MHRLAFAVLALLGSASALAAQYFVPDQSLMRRVSRVSWHGDSGEQNLAVDHGQPKWQASYERLLQGSTAQHARLGSGAWTTLQAGVELTFGTVRIPRGRWYLGVRRDEQKNFELTWMAADAVDKAGVGAFATSTLRPDFAVPLRLQRSEQASELLDITLSSNKLGEQNVTLTIAWGNHRLSTSFVAEFDRRRPPGAPEFAVSAAEALQTTASGLQYEVLRAGAGAFPTANDRVTVHYCGWLADGTQFDSTYPRGGVAPTLGLNQVVKGLAEGLRSMQPGAVFRLRVPPALAYGKAGNGGVVPPDATLVYTVTLLAIEP